MKGATPETVVKLCEPTDRHYTTDRDLIVRAEAAGPPSGQRRHVFGSHLFHFGQATHPSGGRSDEPDHHRSVIGTLGADGHDSAPGILEIHPLEQSGVVVEPHELLDGDAQPGPEPLEVIFGRAPAHSDYEALRIDDKRRLRIELAPAPL